LGTLQSCSRTRRAWRRSCRSLQISTNKTRALQPVHIFVT